MGITKIALGETHLGLANKGTVDEIIYRNMALLIGSCWFYITNSLFIVIRFISMHVFRIKMDDSYRKDDSRVSAMKDSTGLEPLPEATELEERDDSSFGEEETSSFSFKFQHQFLEDTMRTSGELTNPVTNGNMLSTTTDVRKYHLLSEKVLSGFMAEPEAMTFHVQESYVDCSEDNIDDKEKLDTEVNTRFLLAKDFHQSNSFSNLNKSEESKDVILFKNKVLEEEIPMDSKTNSLDEEDFGGFMEKPVAMRYRVQGSYVDCSKDNLDDKEKLNTEFNTRFLLAKDFQQSNSFSNLSKPEESKDVILFKNKLLETNSLDEKNFGGFIEEREAMTFPVQGSYVDCSKDNMNDQEKLDTEFATRFLSAKDFQQSNTFIKLNKSEELKDVILLRNKLLEEELHMSSETSSLDEKVVLDGVKFLSEGFSGFDSDTESESLSDGYSVKNLIVDSDSDGFLSERDFGGHEGESDITETSMGSNRYKFELLDDIGEFDHHLEVLYNPGLKVVDSRGGFVYSKIQTNYEDIDKGFPSKRGFCEPENKPEEKLQTLKETQLPCSSAFQIEFTDSSDDQRSSFRTDRTKLSSSDEVFFVKDLTAPEPKPEDLGGEEAVTISKIPCSEAVHLRNLHNSDINASAPINDSEQVDATLLGRDSNEVTLKPEDLQGKKKAPEADLQKSEETHLEDLDAEDFYELESLWEHQDLIEQLRMELRKVKATGLPTIFEESESPKVSEDLKPWKIDENFLREDPMDELHKFYKSYRERMRKFDILNYQKMYAIGFLQLKDPLQSMGSQKPLIPTLMSHLSQSFWPFCRQKSNNDPSEKFLKELQSDLETVYVGQTCLSWEFLRWQYEKARGLPESDPYRSRQYNQVAGEFQQFQVITRRFIENESFQGPRLPNYVKNRCILRNLVQVPVIKEDCLKDKMEEQRKGNDAITSEMLEDIMEESIRIMWEFVKADKDETPTILKGLIGTHVELQDPSDFELMVDVQAILQKKEKKLKDIQRTGNCLVKKFKKPREDRSNQDLFFSQVDMKLVSMVLKMSRITTDQLVWCHKILSKITFAEGKIQREPSFLLFPC